MGKANKIEFTDKWLKGLARPDKGQLAFTDLLQQGFRVKVSKTDTTFSVQYRLDATGEVKTHTIGRYPEEWKIADARREAGRLLPLLKAGKDPKQEQRAAATAQKKIAGRKITLKDAAPLYVDYFRDHKPGKNGKLGRRSWDSEQSKLVQVVCGAMQWGDRYIDEVDDNDAAQLLDALRDERGINPNRIHSTLIQFWNWAMQPGHQFERPTRNPFLLLDRRGEENKRERVLSQDEVAYLWSVLNTHATKGNAPRSKNTKRVLLVLLLTAQRLSQITGLRRDECRIAPDGTPCFVWSAARMKADKDFVLPMSKTVAAIIEQAKRETNSDLLFPSLDPDCIGQQMARTAPWTYLNNVVKKSDGQLEPASVHDLRATGASMLHEAEIKEGQPMFEPHEISKIMSHAQHADKRTAEATWGYLRARKHKVSVSAFRDYAFKRKLVNALEDLILSEAFPDGGRVTRLLAA